MPPTQDESKLVGQIALSSIASVPADDTDSLSSEALSDYQGSWIPSIASYGSSSTTTTTGEENEEEVHIGIAEPDEAFKKLMVDFPRPATLKSIVESSVSTDGDTTPHNLALVTHLQLYVIARDVGLQHLGALTPCLHTLTLDGSVLGSLRDLGCGLRTLRSLSVNRCGLASLDGVLGLRTVECLSAARNSLRDVSAAMALSELRKLNVSRNKIKDINTLCLLSICEKLECLEIADNAFVQENKNYREIIKEFIPQLKYIDSDNLSPDANSLPSLTKDEELNSLEKTETKLPPITKPSSGKRPNTSGSSSSNSGNATYSVKFPPKIVSPSPSSSSPELSPKNTNLPVTRLELPKI